MTTLFHNMMLKEREVYVDDTIAKSKAEEDHLADFRQIFKLLLKYAEA